MVWNFADTAGQAYDESANLAIKKRQLAFEKVKQMYEMHTQAYQHAWTDVINNDKMPNSMKTQYYNSVVVPYNKNYLGVDTPPVAKWTNDLNDAADKMAGLYDDFKAGKIKLNELQSAMVHIKAEVASNPDAAKAFQPTDEVLNQAMGKVQKEVTVGGKKMLVSQDENGQLHPVSVNGQEASGPTSESITSQKNIQDEAGANIGKFQEAAKIIQASKDGKLAEIFPKMASTEQMAAVNAAKGTMQFLGSQLGMSYEDVDSVIKGDKGTDWLMNKVGKKYAIPGNSATAPKQLPGLTVVPKGSAPAPTQGALPGASPDMAQAPQTTPDQMAEANTPPTENQLADSATQPTDKEEANV